MNVLQIFLNNSVVAFWIRMLAELDVAKVLLLLLLKPLKKAIADHDNIHAVIVATAVNNDGASAGITAPNPKAHADLLARTWDLAGISPEQLDYIEAHGTGTHLGDPIEIRGIEEAVKRKTDKRQFIALGSVKGNIGHLLDGTAGLSGIIKTLHVLQKGIVPPTVHLEEPNQHIDFIDSPFLYQHFLGIYMRRKKPQNL